MTSELSNWKERWSSMSGAEREQLRHKNMLYRHNHKEEGKTYDQRYYQRLKLKVFQHYSGKEMPECGRCEFSDMRALCLDHVNGNGSEDRKRFHGSVHLFRHLRDKGYPDGYQILCANCNYIKASENGERGYSSPSRGETRESDYVRLHRVTIKEGGRN